MNSVSSALQGALHPPPSVTHPGPALLLGAGGWLGAALLSQVLAGGYRRVGAWVRQPMASSHHGFVALPTEELTAPTDAQREAWAGATAFVVLERPGLVGARDAAYAAPSVAQLPAFAQQLRTLGATRLFVVVPHGANSLPDALRHGFANADEQALAAMGFDQVVLVRSSRDAEGLPPGAPWWDRLAAAWWAQLRWIIPDQERPLRSVALARVVVAAARLLRQAPPGVRVLSQGLASRAAQAPEGIESALREWAGV